MTKQEYQAVVTEANEKLRKHEICKGQHFLTIMKAKKELEKSEKKEG